VGGGKKGVGKKKELPPLVDSFPRPIISFFRKKRKGGRVESQPDVCKGVSSGKRGEGKGREKKESLSINRDRRNKEKKGKGERELERKSNGLPSFL